MKHTGTLFLKAVLIVMVLAVLALCIFGIPPLARGISTYLELLYVKYFILTIAFATALTFFLAVYNAWKLLVSTDKNNAFSADSLKALKTIKYCGIAISVFYATSLPIFYLVADKDDAPGLIIVGMVITMAPIVVSVFAAVLEKLIRNAMEIKSENDLTV